MKPWKKKDHPNAIYVVLCKAFVQAAIVRGHIPKATSLTCVDCGARAYCYDHRDYWKPLDVVPVCHTCNVRRGAGAHGVAKSAQNYEHDLFRLRRPDVEARYFERPLKVVYLPKDLRP